MPVLDGLATTEAIRQLDGPSADIKVILVTADVVNDTRKRALDVGVNEFASKPLQANDLQRALHRCGLLDEPARDDAGQDARWVRSAPVPLYDMPVHVAAPRPRSDGVIDWAAYTDIVSMLPKDTMNEMLGNLLDPPHGTLHALIRALETGEHGNTGFIAHNLKGTAMLLGLRAIAQTAAEIERLTQENNDLVAHQQIAQLLNDLKQTQEALACHVAQGTAFV